MHKIKITKQLAQKVLDTIDKGLVFGMGKPYPGKMCVEAAVCYAMGLPHGDEPDCVSEVLRALKIKLNDRGWSSNDMRANGLRRLGLAQLGSAGVLDEREFLRRVQALVVTDYLPYAITLSTSENTRARRQEVNFFANLLKNEPTKQNVRKARDQLSGYIGVQGQDALYCADLSFSLFGDLHASVSNCVFVVGNTANAFLQAIDDVDVHSRVFDQIHWRFAEDVVQILQTMNAPGCQWLELTE